MSLKSINYKLLGILLIALAVRLFWLLRGVTYVDSDEAIFGLMGKHILEGREFPIFYYGAAYLGSLTGYILAVFYFFFGVSYTTLKAAALCFSLAGIVGIYFLSRLFLDEKYSLCAALFSAIAPKQLLWDTLRFGGQNAILLYSIVALILFWKLIYLRSPSDRKISHVILIGTCFGVFFWASQQFLYFLCYFFVLGVLELIQLRKRRPDLAKAAGKYVLFAVCFFIGATPYWYGIATAPKNAATIQIDVSGLSEIMRHLKLIFVTYLPRQFGFGNKVSLIQMPVYLVYISTFFYAFYGACRILIELVRGKVLNREQHGHLLSVSLVIMVLIFAVSGKYHFDRFSARYIFLMYAVYPVVFCCMLSVLSRRFRPVTVLFLGMVLVFNSVIFWTQPRRDQARLYSLIDHLKETGVTHCFADYWVSYRLVFLTNEEIICTPHHGVDRYPEYTRSVIKAGGRKSTFIFDTHSKEQNKQYEGFKKFGSAFDERNVAGYVIASKSH